MTSPGGNEAVLVDLKTNAFIVGTAYRPTWLFQYDKVTGKFEHVKNLPKVRICFENITKNMHVQLTLSSLWAQAPPEWSCPPSTFPAACDDNYLAVEVEGDGELVRELRLQRVLGVVATACD